MSDMADLQKQEKKNNSDTGVVTMKFEAISQLFLAASIQDDNVQADLLRQQLHALLDQKLDCQARAVQIAKKLLQL